MPEQANKDVVNVFFSFLGTTGYYKTVYYLSENLEKRLKNPVKFAPEAVVELVLQDFWNSETDRCYVFLTGDESAQENFKELQVKLQERAVSTEAIAIEDGGAIADIWHVFDAILSVFERSELQGKYIKLHLDITYGFRWLPMLGLVLSDYAMSIQDGLVELEGIYYGNYEYGKAEQSAKIIEQDPKALELDENKNRALGKWLGENKDWAANNPVNAPIIELHTFAKLLQWNAATRAFVKSGSTELLQAVLADKHSDIGNQLHEFALAIKTCRGQELTRSFPFNEFKEKIEALSKESEGVIPPLKQLLAKVSEKLQPFVSEDSKNGMHAVQWCIDNGMIQQGYTILQETIKTWLIEKAVHELNMPDVEKMRVFYKIREAANLASTGKNERELKILEYDKKKKDAQGNKEIKGVAKDLQIFLPDVPRAQAFTQKLENIVSRYPKFADNYGKMTGSKGLRNDINHAGFKEGTTAAKAEKLKEDLRELFAYFKGIILA